jgi:hypothetical protein
MFSFDFQIAYEMASLVLPTWIATEGTLNKMITKLDS